MEPAIHEGGLELQPRLRPELYLAPDGTPQRQRDGHSAFSHDPGLGKGAGRASVAEPQEPVGWLCRGVGVRHAPVPRRFLQDVGANECPDDVLVGFWGYVTSVRVESLAGAPRLTAGVVGPGRRRLLGLLEESDERLSPLVVTPQPAPAEEGGAVLRNAAVGPVPLGLPAWGRGGGWDVSGGEALEVLGAQGPAAAAVVVKGRLHSDVALRVPEPSVPRAWGEDGRVAQRNGHGACDDEAVLQDREVNRRALFHSEEARPVDVMVPPLGGAGG